MEDTWKHFAFFLLEYCVLPAAIFFVVFFTKKLETPHSVFTISDHSLRTNGFEFVLIEAVTSVSLFLRVISSTNCNAISDSLYYLVLFILLCGFILLFIFLYGFIKYSKITTTELSSIRLTFFPSFVSWVLRIIFLAYYSGLLKENAVSYSFSCLVLLVSYYVFKNNFYHYFIGWRALIQEMNQFYENRLYKNAKKGGRIILRMSENRDGDYLTAYHGTLLTTGASYLKEGKTSSRGYSKICKRLNKYINQPISVKLDIEWHILLLISLYCMAAKKKKAEEVLDKHKIRVNPEVVDLLEKGDCINIFPG